MVVECGEYRTFRRDYDGSDHTIVVPVAEVTCKQTQSVFKEISQFGYSVCVGSFLRRLNYQTLTPDRVTGTFKLLARVRNESFLLTSIITRH